MGCFNGHPPLGVNATGYEIDDKYLWDEFQRAPTLGGECYEQVEGILDWLAYVSTGTHPWG